MKQSSHSSPSSKETKISHLVRILRDTEQQLRELTGDEFEAVAEEHGIPLLLQNANKEMERGESAPGGPAPRESILDALPAHVALIDPKGDIVFVNKAWRKFGLTNGAGPDAGIGQNYITLCEMADGDCSEEAIQVATGIRQVLTGAKPHFTLEYPCHSTDEQRWFRLMVTALSEGRTSGAVVMHVDITARKLVEESLRQNQSMLRMASQVGRIGAWRVELPDSKVIWSDQVSAIHEVENEYIPTFDEAIGFYAPEWQETIRAHYNACATDGVPYDLELQIITAKGRRVWVRSIGEPMRNQLGAIIGVQGAFQDINERKEVENSLIASENRFRELAESMPMIVWTATSDGVIDFSNHHLADYSGTSPDEPPATRWQKTLHPDDLDRCLEAWNQSITTEKPFEIEYRIRRHDGAHRWFHVQALPVRDEDGYVTKWYGTATDINETKCLQAEATELATRLTTTLESITDAFFTLDRTWCFTYLNAEAEHLLERSRKDLIGNSIWDEFPEAVGSGFDREYHRAVSQNTTVTLEEYFPPLARWFEVKAYPSPDGLAVYFRDSTESRKNRDALREQATLLDKAQDAIMVRDLDHRILYWNKSAERLYGWSANEAIGRSIKDLLYTNPTDFLSATRKTIETGDWLGEIKQCTKQGNELAVEGRWSLVRDDQGNAKSILAINTDVTERKKIEAQFLRAQRMESIGTLAGGIAHDLNNLLAPIVMGVGLIKQFDTQPNVQAVLDTMEESAKRGTDLIKQVLSFARGVEGTRVPVQLAHILREITSIVHKTFPKNITFEEDIQRDLWLINGDATQLNQVFLNLCVNARDAMENGGNMFLTARNLNIDEHLAAMSRGLTAGPYVVVEVSDEGCGMPKEHADRAFEPFFTTKELGKGTGLGLSTASGIVRSHSGVISVYSEVDKGSVFKVYLPAETGVTTASSEPKADLAPRGHGERILVVDDETSILTITRQTLEAFGYNVIIASDGAQAIRLYAQEQESVALVLTDMMMPIMDGPALITGLRRINPNVRIIAASGLNAKGNIAKPNDAGVDHFLAKPYSAERMLTLIRTVLTETSPNHLTSRR